VRRSDPLGEVDDGENDQNQDENASDAVAHVSSFRWRRRSAAALVEVMAKTAISRRGLPSSMTDETRPTNVVAPVAAPTASTGSVS
jgi:hypothetical protein